MNKKVIKKYKFEGAFFEQSTGFLGSSYEVEILLNLSDKYSQGLKELVYKTLDDIVDDFDHCTVFSYFLDEHLKNLLIESSVRHIEVIESELSEDIFSKEIYRRIKQNKGIDVREVRVFDGKNTTYVIKENIFNILINKLWK